MPHIQSILFLDFVINACKYLTCPMKGMKLHGHISVANFILFSAKPCQGCDVDASGTRL